MAPSPEAMQAQSGGNEESMGFNLLLVEDDQAYATTLRAELAGHSHNVRWVTDGRQAYDAVYADQYDAMILDRMIPELDGLSLLQRLRESGLTMPVLMLSARGKSNDKVTGLHGGADDYVVKPVSGDELDARLHALLRARKWTEASADTIRVGDIVISPAQYRAWRNGRVIDLINLELKLLVELARNPDIVLTRAMLLERVWGYDFEPATNVVEVYIKRLRNKLVAEGESDPIVTVRRVGYVLRP